MSLRLQSLCHGLRSRYAVSTSHKFFRADTSRSGLFLHRRQDAVALGGMRNTCTVEALVHHVTMITSSSP